ncbi:MAG: hypothetical protein QOH29_2291, partial [Actinomycetota bacterium]|nr:hypothetical protein [Actinomycetota bacterium]
MQKGVRACPGSRAFSTSEINDRISDIRLASSSEMAWFSASSRRFQVSAGSPEQEETLPRVETSATSYASGEDA